MFDNIFSMLKMPEKSVYSIGEPRFPNVNITYVFMRTK